MMLFRFLLASLMVLGTLRTSASAQPVVRDDVTATVQQTDGNIVTGVLENLSLKEITLRDQTPIPLGRVVRLDCAGTPIRFAPNALVLLANGDRLVAELVSQDEAHLTAKWVEYPSLPALPIPLETVQAVSINAPGSLTDRNAFWRMLLNASPKNDVLLLKSGDQFTGEFAEADAKTISLTTQTATTKLPREATRAMVLNSELISLPKTPEQRLLLTFSDGSRFTAKSLEVKDGNCVVTCTTGLKLSLPLTELRIAQPIGFGVKYLSEFASPRYTHTKFLSTSWPYRKDRSVSGGWLSLRGQPFARGIGMHSESTLEFELNGEYERFTATIGIDDAAGDRGSVIFVVTVDDQEVYRSDVLTRQAAPVALPKIDLQGKQKLQLSILFGPFGDIQDHANWGDALLIRKQ